MPQTPAPQRRQGAPAVRPRPPGAPDMGTVLGELAITAAGIGTFDWDLRSGRVTIDAALARLYGWDARTPLERDAAGLVGRAHPEDRGTLEDALTTAVESSGELAVEHRIVQPDGTPRWVASRGRVLHDRDGVAVRMLGASYDITERQAGEARTARVLESMPTAFFSLDRDWRFRYVNAEGERVLGATRQDLLGGVVWDLFPAANGSDFETHYRGAVASGEPVAFDAYYPPPLDAWYEVVAWPGPDGLAVYFLDVTSRRRMQEEADRSVRRAALIAQVTAQLTETLDGVEAVARLAELVVPALADWCLVTLVDDDEQAGTRRGLRDIGWAHVDPAALPVVRGYAQQRLTALRDHSFLSRALRTGEMVVVGHGAAAAIDSMLGSAPARELIARLAPETVVVLPLRGRGGTVGLMSLFGGAQRAPLTADELAVAQEVAGHAGLALDNSRLFRQQRQLAEGLQRALLTQPPRTDQLDIAVRYVPAGEAAQVGGDWYDAFAQRDGATVLVIGDVVGHDIVAAAAMGQLRSLLRGIAVATGAGPGELLREVDRAMVTLRASTIATAVVARVEPPEPGTGARAVRWSNAGHPPPMLIAPDGSVSTLVAEHSDLLLGVVPDASRLETRVVLEPGATLFLYTDGLVERRGQSLSDGFETLRTVLSDAAGLDPEALCDAVLGRLLPERRNDDVALVAVRVALADPST
ncbi:SpoIIE family protein phosphatase [uncultured Cellulomonas sp.]|uniref:SpoIIE family protein phosphatase n=1 Tax=uncultured Cellulomonas sp. TaxID=189682 RepID=UPI0026265876|nr:SpoIIE family protein phosphatase [uncultured Cellulomonas sp.]